MAYWIWFTAISSILFLYLLFQEFLIPKIIKKRDLRLPPGPRELPIIGHFHLLGKNPHHDLHRLAQKHGPIMYMKLGSVPTIIASSGTAAKLFLKTHDLVFASRPHHEVSFHLCYEQRNITFGKYSQYWRDMRKLMTLELLSHRKVTQFQSMRKAELNSLMTSLKQAADLRETVDLSDRGAALNADMTCLMLFGRKLTDKDGQVFGTQKGRKDVTMDILDEAGAFNIGDYFPHLRSLDLHGTARRMRNLRKALDVIFEKIMDEHVQNKKNINTKAGCQDFLDTMMDIANSGDAGFEFDRRHIKAVILDMIVAGTDTSAVSVEWTLSELIRHPLVMEKLQQELKLVVGMDQIVEESHLPNLDYLNCVVKESLRLHPVVPLLPNESMEDCLVDGFYIPKQTRLIVNLRAIGRDPKTWNDPERFSPDRFIGSNVDLRGHDYELIPFGAGRRGCPGLHLGLTLIQLMVAQLVHCFDWELPDGMLPKDLDMTEKFGLVCPRAKHLLAIPTYRLHK
ncbi:hypothetical protein RD792_005711 [Penstemon davidsonii]|uniref:Cytochrome P450 n=1 Tax=Penstemon davidsonii TaxID=160366 RepID=A0ABR0DEG6_9LAMI|nr:hypothetical protein RD792_005711 [Penstemon davidsonii]